MSINLNQNEILRLLKEWRENGNKKAIELLIEKYSDIVKGYAVRFGKKGISIQDLVSAGNIGLINALKTFDYNETNIAKLTAHVKRGILDSINAEIEDYIKFSKGVLHFNDKISTGKCRERNTIKNLVATENDYDEESDEYEKLYKGLKTLTKRERDILFLRFGLEAEKIKTQEELAEIYGCTKEEVEITEQKALKKMRNQNFNN